VTITLSLPSVRLVILPPGPSLSLSLRCRQTRLACNNNCASYCYQRHQYINTSPLLLSAAINIDNGIAIDNRHRYLISRYPPVARPTRSLFSAVHPFDFVETPPPPPPATTQALSLPLHIAACPPIVCLAGVVVARPAAATSNLVLLLSLLHPPPKSYTAILVCQTTATAAISSA
jgi:hypothetical protein